MSAMSELHMELYQEFIEDLSAPDVAELLLEHFTQSNGIEFVSSLVLDDLMHHIQDELTKRELRRLGLIVNYRHPTLLAACPC